MECSKPSVVGGAYIAALKNGRRFTINQPLNDIKKKEKGINLIMKTETISYELQLTIKEGAWISACPQTTLFVETSVDGKIDQNDRTAVSKIVDRKATWNKVIVKRFSTLEPATPIMISMSMYKKRLFQEGFKLIGTAHLSLYELIPILNKGTVQGKISLNMKKNHTAESFFVVAINLQTVSSAGIPTLPLKQPINNDLSKAVQYAPVENDIEALEIITPKAPEYIMNDVEQVTHTKSIMSSSFQFSLLLAIMFIALTTCGLYQVLLD